MKRKFISSKFVRVVTLGSMMVVVSILVAWAVHTMFTIRNVEVVGDGIDVVIDRRKLPGNLLFFPSRQIGEALAKEYPLIASVRITKKYPSTLTIILTARKPLVILGTGSDLYSLDGEGFVIRQYPDETNLPRIYLAVQPLVPGSQVKDGSVRNAVRFIRETTDLLNISEVRMYDTIALVAEANRMRIVFRVDADVSNLVRTLQMMISGFRIKGKLPAVIDVRFNKPVVTF
ncbi:FtsQ-type POTRA domain-containing protein [Candidatus Gottesmanbacteria bacterium]|nr:FtsQ-type POTRA domain-containing protein [Candidatus Gottesmanbacteria bacterium]